jgi:heme/copper-type cytochrome/quinol oxidase subunit 2
MNDWMDGSDWVWMTLSMAVGIVVLGAVIYAAVRLASRDSRQQR